MKLLMVFIVFALAFLSVSTSTNYTAQDGYTWSGAGTCRDGRYESKTWGMNADGGRVHTFYCWPEPVPCYCVSSDGKDFTVHDEFEGRGASIGASTDRIPTEYEITEFPE